jgi:hypothetical protein
VKDTNAESTLTKPFGFGPSGSELNVTVIGAAFATVAPAKIQSIITTNRFMLSPFVPDVSEPYQPATLSKKRAQE